MLLQINNITACAETAKTTPPGIEDGYHRVDSGDTMYKIAKTYDISLNQLVDDNPQIKDPDVIFPGQVLLIRKLNSKTFSGETNVA